MVEVVGKDVDVVVVGLGAFGSAVAWRLASRGVSVMGLERHGAPNSFGSSHGQTRLFRAISQDHVDLYPLAMLSRDLWVELGEVGGEDVYDQTGGLVIGPVGGELISNTERVLHAHSIRATQLDAGGIREEFPEFESVDDQDVGYFDSNAGVLRPERCVAQLCNAAKEAGADLREYVDVYGFEAGVGEVHLETSIGDVRARKVVFATGAWTAEFLPQLRLQPIRIPQCWFAYSSAGGGAPDLTRVPPFQRELGIPGSIWGHGEAEPGGLAKVGTHGNPWMDRSVDPRHIDRVVHEHDLKLVRDLVSIAFPSLDPIPARANVCLLTETPDGQFVIGEVEDERVLVASGGSGKGFKHATGVGEVIADICAGITPRVDAAFVSPARLLS